ncbi:hypothetical protein, partial [Streptococcus pneumoniae]|uniref:hypothetical protein n=1 Tax=Streptococcus pneumoniae TaxID=1313 RepID=UPI001E56A1AA
DEPHGRPFEHSTDHRLRKQSGNPQGNFVAFTVFKGSFYASHSSVERYQTGPCDLQGTAGGSHQ